MLEFHYIFLILIIFYFTTRPIIVFLHELGHAIPALLITKEKVSIYIGSYGDPSQSLKFTIGLLEIWFKYNPFNRKGGVCVPSGKIISINKKIIYILSGSITSVIIPLIMCYFTFLFDLSGIMKFLITAFLGFSVLHLLIDLIPSDKEIKLYNGKVVFNDGYALKTLLYYKNFPKEFTTAVELYTEKDFEAAGKIFNKIIDNGLKDGKIYQLAISCDLQIHKYEKAKILVDKFALLGTMDADDYSNAGLTYSKLGLHDKAVEFYDTSLEKNPKHLYSLNNKGYTLNLINRFEEAIVLFDKAIEIDNKFYYSYSNRGLSKIKLGRTDEGLKDIDDSLKIEENNSYAYRNLGIYHFDKGEKEKALELFMKAKELDPLTEMVDELISEVSNS